MTLLHGEIKYESLTNRIYNYHLPYFRFYNKHSSFFTALCVTDVCEGFLGVAPRTGSLFLSLPLSLSLSAPLSDTLSCAQRSLTSQPSHNDPDLVGNDIQPQSQYIDSSSSTNSPLTKSLPTARQYFEPSVHCSSVVL